MSPLQKDKAFLIGISVCASLAGVISIFIFAFLAKESVPALVGIHPWQFVTDATWFASENQYNVLPLLYGSILVSVGAVVFATPLGVLSGLFCNFYGPPAITGIYRSMVHLLAGIPSVIFGFWGLVSLVPLVGRIHPPGPSLLAGIIVLGLMILPTIMVILDGAMATFSLSYLNSAVALGLSKWGMVRGLILPSLRKQVLVSMLLGLARSIGETMAILMVCGNIVRFPESVFNPIRTLTANIALEMPFAMNVHRSALFFTGLIMMVLVTMLMIMAQTKSRRRA